VTSGRCGTRHDAMMARIVPAARAQLSQGREVSLRGVAGQVGMTPPAVYRYVASRDHLLDLVVAAVDNDIEAHVAAAIEMHAREDPNSALVAALVAYRSWALGNRAEFRLLVQHSGTRGPGTRCGAHPRSVKLVVDLAVRGRPRRSG
jgi:AcrR family transcriptional regulator